MSQLNTLPRRVAESRTVGSDEQLRQLQDLINGLDITRHMGGLVELEPDGRAIARINQLSEFHLGGAEVDAVSGTVLLGMLDCVNAAAAMMRVPGHRCATVELSIKFLRQVRPQPLTAIGTCIRRSGRLLFTQGEVYDWDGEVCVTATGVVSIVAPRKLG